MSYAICRVDKCNNAHDIAGIQIHDRRERTHSNSNPDIDYTRSAANYSLCNRADGKTFNATIDEIIADEYTSPRAIRKDAVRMVQLLFTSDNEFFADKTPEEQRRYFEDCYKWAAKRFGESHIISAEVHMDERTPHMHLNFVPLVQDVNKKTGEVITTLNVHKAVGSGSRALQKLQDDFYKAVGIPNGLQRGNRADLDIGEPTRRHERVQQHKETTKYYEKERNALQATVQALQAQEQAYNDIIHSAPKSPVQGTPVPSMAKIAVGKENKDKLLYSPQEIEQVQKLAVAAAVVSAANEQHKQELVARQKELTAEETRIRQQNSAYYRQQTEWHRAAITEQNQLRSAVTAADEQVQRREYSVSKREQAVETREYRLSEEEKRINKRLDDLAEIEERPDKHYQSIIRELQARIDELYNQHLQRDIDDEEMEQQLQEIEQLIVEQNNTISALEQEVQQLNYLLSEQGEQLEQESSTNDYLNEQLQQAYEEIARISHIADYYCGLHYAAIDIAGVQGLEITDEMCKEVSEKCCCSQESAYLDYPIYDSQGVDLNEVAKIVYSQQEQTYER